MFLALGSYLKHLVALTAGQFQIDEFTSLRMACGALYLAITWDSFWPDLHAWIAQGPALVVLLIWSLDMLSGTALSLLRRQFSPTRSAFGVLKLLIWLGALAVAWLLRVDGYPVDDLFAPVLELVVILTEASSVLRNLAELMEAATGKRSKVLEFFAARIDLTQEVLMKRLEAVEQTQAELAEQNGSAT